MLFVINICTSSIWGGVWRPPLGYTFTSMHLTPFNLLAICWNGQGTMVCNKISLLCRKQCLEIERWFGGLKRARKGVSLWISLLSANWNILTSIFLFFFYFFSMMWISSHPNGMEVHPWKFIKSQDEIKFIQEIEYIISFHP